MKLTSEELRKKLKKFYEDVRPDEDMDQDVLDSLDTIEQEEYPWPPHPLYPDWDRAEPHREGGK